jgi:flavin reductase (DIM6/NTAB) family NADH-FMN oxidoreductase RutF
MSLSAGAAAIVPEAPRVTISITKFDMSHDMILESGVFAMHLLGNDPATRSATRGTSAEPADACHDAIPGFSQKCA